MRMDTTVQLCAARRGRNSQYHVFPREATHRKASPNRGDQHEEIKKRKAAPHAIAIAAHQSNKARPQCVTPESMHPHCLWRCRLHEAPPTWPSMKTRAMCLRPTARPGRCGLADHLADGSAALSGAAPCAKTKTPSAPAGSKRDAGTTPAPRRADEGQLAQPSPYAEGATGAVGAESAQRRVGRFRQSLALCTPHRGSIGPARPSSSSPHKLPPERPPALARQRRLRDRLSANKCMGAAGTASATASSSRVWSESPPMSAKGRLSANSRRNSRRGGRYS